jgi:pimeloyl-ACP methyl ester carboxylesterase
MGDFPYRNPDEARYDGPTLFIRGTKSDYVTDEVLPVIGRFFPMFKLLDIESGHWVISEQPAAFREGEYTQW